METKTDIFKKFNIKSCAIELEKVIFKRINIRCIASTSEEDVKLTCHVEQKDANTFSVKINRSKTSFAGMNIFS